MIECESIARKWGNSIGLTLPKETVNKCNIKENRLVRFIIIEDENPIKKTFGMLRRWKKPTKQIIAEMREDTWDE